MHVVLGVVFLCLLWWRWQVSQTRFFDVDEFSYLHWVANLVRGEKPYVDFFLIFTPGFLWVFAPIVKAFWMSAGVFLAARVMAFGIFLGILGCVGYLFGKTRGWKWALVPVIILAFLPMPYDKFLEVRPDNLATLMGLVGLICQIHWLNEGKKQWAFWSGIFYSLSLLVFIKMLPFVAVGLVVAWFTEHKKEFFVGFVAPGIVFLLWLTSLGDFSTAWYSITQLPFETTLVGKTDIMEPHLFFFPNASFYGGWGMTPGFLANHAVWVIGIVMGVYRLFTAWGDRKKMLGEVLIAGTFICLVYGYVRFFPLKHSQYLIPIAIFISYFAADALALFFSKIKFAVFVFAVAIVVINANVNAPKLLMSNTVQMNQMNALLTVVPENTSVLDLEGRMLFWPDAYYICCVSFGSFTHFMSRKPEPLLEALETGSAGYIFQGDSNRLAALSAQDRQYIQSHYESVAGWGDALLVLRAQR